MKGTKTETWAWKLQPTHKALKKVITTEMQSDHEMGDSREENLRRGSVMKFEKRLTTAYKSLGNGATTDDQNSKPTTISYALSASTEFYGFS